MKSLFILLFISGFFIPSYSQSAFPPAWGHYQVLSNLAKTPHSDKKDEDKKEFDLAPAETRVRYIDRVSITIGSSPVLYPIVPEMEARGNRIIYPLIPLLVSRIRRPTVQNKRKWS